MKTEDLIRAMAADAVVVPAPESRLLWLAPALALALAGLWATLGLRQDLATALITPVSSLRIVLTVALGLVALRAAMTLARPGQGATLWPLAALVAVALGLWLWTFALVPPGGHQMAIVGKTMVGCLTTIPLMAVLPTAVLLLALRNGAPTRPMLAGAMAGLAGGGFSAALYALHCTEDSPLFYVTWYSLAISGVAVAAALVAGRFLRW